MVLATHPFRNVIRVSRPRFAALLVGSPVLAEREADQYYDAIVASRLDPLFVLAMFNHEKALGRKTSFPRQNYGWGNPGYPSFGPQPVDITVHPATKKEFPVYQNWLDGLLATLARLNQTAFPEGAPYAQRLAIAQLFVHPSGRVWAPAGDSNDVAGYLASVLRYMTTNQDMEQVMGDPYARLTTHVKLLPQTANNWGKRLMWGGSPDSITVHETGNVNPGATARMHADFVANGGGADEVSFHAVVDELESWQLMPWNWVAWHGGDGSGGACNNDSIAIETVQIGDFKKTAQRLVKLVVDLMLEFNIPLNKVQQHNACSGKNCPQFLRSGSKGVTWAAFLGQVSVELARRTAPAAPTVTPTPAVPQGDPNKVLVSTRINELGEAILEINFRGRAKRVIAVNIQDVGISVEGYPEGAFHRSVIDNQQREWIT